MIKRKEKKEKSEIKNNCQVTKDDLEKEIPKGKAAAAAAKFMVRADL